MRDMITRRISPDHVIERGCAGDDLFGVAFEHSAKDRIATPHRSVPGFARDCEAVEGLSTTDRATENLLHFNEVIGLMDEGYVGGVEAVACLLAQMENDEGDSVFKSEGFARAVIDDADGIPRRPEFRARRVHR